MTVLNIVTQKGVLTIATAAFAVLCLVNLLLVKKGGDCGAAVGTGTLDALVRAADEAMLQAKNDGRNRAVFRS